MSPEETLLAGCQQLGLVSADAAAADRVNQLRIYLAELIKWNKAYNLTAIRQPQEMVVKHLLDSLVVVPTLDQIAAAHAAGDKGAARPLTCLDVGTGAGLPGMPLALWRPQHQWTLVDSNGKKTRFLVQTSATLGMTNVTVSRGRIEALAQPETFDVITSRAFASLLDFVALSVPYLRPGGRLLALKGVVPEEEMAQLRAEQPALECSVTPVQVPYLDEQRHIITVQYRAGD